MAKNNTSLRLESKIKKFVNDFPKGTDFTKKISSLINDFEILLKESKKDILKDFSNVEIEILVKSIEEKELEKLDIIEYKSYLIKRLLKISKCNELIEKISSCDLFKVYVLIIWIIQFKKDNESNVIPSKYYFLIK